MSATLTAEHVRVVLGGRTILHDVSLSIAPGALTAILGPNGSGKSTLLRALAGLRPPEAGRVLLDGAPLDQQARQALARRLSFLPQDTRCDFAFTVEEMVAMGRHPHRGRFTPASARDHQAVDDAIAICDLEDLRGRTVDHLSGGERQRVAIARCLATTPDVILLDEPTAHLDIEHGLSILSLCRTLTDSGRTIAIATHDLAAVLRYATAAVVLHHGHVAVAGAPLDVLTPGLCRDVFAVQSELVRTADGGKAFVFSGLRGTGAQGHRGTGALGHGGAGAQGHRAQARPDP
jgi:iron complex transport system ATP-binding protein